MRLPNVPHYFADVPPASSAPPIGLQGAITIPDPEGLETDNQNLPFPAGLNTGGNELLLFSTKRRWKAIDVYVQPNPGGPLGGAPVQGTVTIYIYAKVAGVRSLVASGRVTMGLGGGPQPSGVSRWTAGARSCATTWEVSWIWSAPAAPPLGNPQPGGVTITCCATDRTDPVPSGIGEIQREVAFFGLFDPAQPQLPQLELVGLQGSLGAAVAAPRWLHVFDTPVPPVAVLGAVPLISMPLGSIGGQGATDRLVRYRSSANLVVVASSTQLTTTGVSDVQIGVTVR